MWEAIGELFVRLLEGWLSWRFCVFLVTVVLIGVFVMPRVPEGVPSAVVAGILMALGVGGGLWWEAKRD
jgi:hypothetical protein